MILELKHITPYFPYGLQIIPAYPYNYAVEVHSLNETYINGMCGDTPHGLEDIKPIIRPIGSITEDEALELLELFTGRECRNTRVSRGSHDIAISGSTSEYTVIVFISYSKTHAKIYQNGRVHDVSLAYDAYEWLFSKHFDVFGLIEKGLAINKDKTKIK